MIDSSFVCPDCVRVFALLAEIEALRPHICSSSPLFITHCKRGPERVSAAIKCRNVFATRIIT